MTRLYLACLVALMARPSRKRSRREWQRKRDLARREQRAIRERSR